MSTKITQVEKVIHYDSGLKAFTPMTILWRCVLKYCVFDEIYSKNFFSTNDLNHDLSLLVVLSNSDVAKEDEITYSRIINLIHELRSLVAKNKKTDKKKLIESINSSINKMLYLTGVNNCYVSRARTKKIKRNVNINNQSKTL